MQPHDVKKQSKEIRKVKWVSLQLDLFIAFTDSCLRLRRSL
jgi:hypothetical protein